MIDDKVKQAHAELTARDKRNSRFVIVGILVLLAGVTFYFSSFSSPSSPSSSSSITGRAPAVPIDAACVCDDTGCTGTLRETVGGFTVGKVVRAGQNHCADASPVAAALFPRGEPILTLLGDSCAANGNIFTLTVDNQPHTFTTSCIDDNYLTQQQSGTLGSFECAGNNLNVFKAECACVDGTCNDGEA